MNGVQSPSGGASILGLAASAERIVDSSSTARRHSAHDRRWSLDVRPFRRLQLVVEVELDNARSVTLAARHAASSRRHVRVHERAAQTVHRGVQLPLHGPLGQTQAPRQSPPASAPDGAS